MADFKPALKKILQFEGGYSNDPDDAGGETYKGISRRYHPDWRGWEKIDSLKESHNFPGNCEADPNLEEKVGDHYRQFYWNRFLGDEISDQNIAEELFDTAVNLGVGRAVSFLQQGLNLLNRNETLYADLVVDSSLGLKTLGALKTYLESDRPDILLKIMNVLQGKHYIDYMTRSPVQEKFARDWFSRVEFIKK